MHTNEEQWHGLCFRFMTLGIRSRPAITLLFAWSVTASVRPFSEEENRLKERFRASPVLFRDVEVPQSGDWWLLGPLKGGHKERSEHSWRRWHDPNFTGCLPWTHRCPSADLQQRVSVAKSLDLHCKEKMVFFMTSVKYTVILWCWLTMSSSFVCYF